MDLRNGNITVGEILNNPEARAILYREIPQYMNPMTLSLGRSLTLNQVLGQVRGRLSQQKIDSILSQLRQV